MNPQKCALGSCIALAVEGEPYCAVHRFHERVDRLLGMVPPLERITDGIERDKSGSPVRFYPKVR